MRIPAVGAGIALALGVLTGLTLQPTLQGTQRSYPTPTSQLDPGYLRYLEVLAAQADSLGSASLSVKVGAATMEVRSELGHGDETSLPLQDEAGFSVGFDAQPAPRPASLIAVGAGTSYEPSSESEPHPPPVPIPEGWDSRRYPDR